MQAPLALRPFAFASLAACLIAAGSATPAGALGITPDPVVFSVDLGGGLQFLEGNIDFVNVVTGTPAGGTVLAGSVGATDVTFIFTTSIDVDSDQGMTSTTIFRTPASASSPVFTGAGTIAGGGVDVGSAFVGSSSATLLHDNPVLQPGETTDAWFVSFSSISVGDQLGFEFVVLPLGTATVVPEPHAAVLVLLGLGALAWRVRRTLRTL
jgi:hypothetical protein